MKNAENRDQLYENTLDSFGRIGADCKLCQKTAPVSRRFKFKIGTEDLKLDNSVQVHTMFLYNRPVFNAVDEATNFSTDAFLRNKSAAEIWRTIQARRILTYLGTLDFYGSNKGPTTYSEKWVRHWKPLA